MELKPPDRAPAKRSPGHHHSGDRRERDDQRQPATAAPTSRIAGYEVRALAVRLIWSVLDEGRSLDDALARELALPPASEMAARDKGLARLIAGTVLRRRGQLDAVLSSFLDRPLPADRGRLTTILLAAAAQLLFLDIAPHAVINIAVEQCRHDRGARRFDKLANAVLRRTAERGGAMLAGDAQVGAETASASTDSRLGVTANLPPWLWQRWVAAYGEAQAVRIAAASLQEAALDITVAADPAAWAARLGGVRLPTGSVRLLPQVRIDELEGFADGAWWVQDTAASLPARLLGDVGGRAVADLCAAPGGKTAQLAATGARVIAVEKSAGRLDRLRDNLRRLKLDAELVCADATTWAPGQELDAVLLDAPCTATGTIRRHPDILHLKRPGDIAQLTALQARLIDNAFGLLRSGGTLVYCTCSLEPEEGPDQIRAFLARQPAAVRAPIDALGIGGRADWLTADGDLRTLPCHLPNDESRLAGMDGFYAARLVRTA